jgi:hypothetical protein
VGIEEKSGQLIECVNPEHWKLGSIHYIQSDCVAKLERPVSPLCDPIWVEAVDSLRLGYIRARFRADSDESWQASEALLKR